MSLLGVICHVGLNQGTGLPPVLCGLIVPVSTHYDVLQGIEIGHLAAGVVTRTLPIAVEAGETKD